MTDVQTRYDLALETLMAKARTDPSVLAAVLLGSMAHDTVWQRSDIDVLLVVEENKKKKEGLCLVEGGVSIHCMLTTRSEFRRMLEGSVQGSFLHSTLSKGRLLFSRDEPLKEIFDARHSLAERDRTIQMLHRIQDALAGFAKAEKWFHVRKDYSYSAFWVLKCVDSLASVEVLLNGEVPAREVVQQALQFNPPFFHTIYTDLIDGALSAEKLERALGAIDAYLKSNAERIFEPILTYLIEEGALRSMTDINHYFERHYSLERVDTACEWLADEGYLHKLAVPVRLTNRSHVNFEEAAYSYKPD